MAICVTLYQSLSSDLQNRVNQDPAAMQHKAKREAGYLWKFIKEVIQGVGYSDAMIYKSQSYTKFVDSINAIEARYSANADKVRLWQDFKTHRYVQALKDHDEFRDYPNQKVLTER